MISAPKRSNYLWFAHYILVSYSLVHFFASSKGIEDNWHFQFEMNFFFLIRKKTLCPVDLKRKKISYYKCNFRCHLPQISSIETNALFISLFFLPCTRTTIIAQAIVNRANELIFSSGWEPGCVSIFFCFDIPCVSGGC